VQDNQLVGAQHVTAWSHCAIVLMPVEMMMGLPVFL